MKKKGNIEMQCNEIEVNCFRVRRATQDAARC